MDLQGGIGLGHPVRVLSNTAALRLSFFLDYFSGRAGCWLQCLAVFVDAWVVEIIRGTTEPGALCLYVYVPSMFSRLGALVQ